MADAARRTRDRPRVDGRKLVLLETLLVVGLAQEIAEDGILAWHTAHPLLRVALAAGLVVGSFGGMMLVLQQVVRRGIVRTHDAVRRLPLPAPLAVAHAGALAAIFFAYAWYWDGRTGALGALADLGAGATAWVRSAIGR